MFKLGLFPRLFLCSFLLNALVGFSSCFAAGFPSAPSSGVLIKPVISANWAGYIADNNNYTSITASWTVPYVGTPAVSSPTLSADTAWVGIGGVKSNDLIQAGTETIVQNGIARYYFWYELLPGGSTSLPYNLKAGDSVSVSITEISNGNWKIVFTDQSSGLSMSKVVQYSSSHSSAEWIVEMPANYQNRQMINLDNFGTINFINAAAVENGQVKSISAPGTMAVKMVRGPQTLAEASSLNYSGNSFSVTRVLDNQILASTLLLK